MPIRLTDFSPSNFKPMWIIIAIPFVGIGAMISLLLGGGLLIWIYSSHGHEKSLEELNKIFTQNQTSFEQLVALCGDQPSLRTARTFQSSYDPHLGVTKKQVEAASKRSIAILKKIDAYSSYCIWDREQNPPRLYSLDVGFYFEEDKQGVHRQDITYYAPTNLPGDDDLVSAEDNITLTPLPAQGWYIWEEGINHEPDKP